MVVGSELVTQLSDQVQILPRGIGLPLVTVRDHMSKLVLLSEEISRDDVVRTPSIVGQLHPALR